MVRKASCRLLFLRQSIANNGLLRWKGLMLAASVDDEQVGLR